MHALKHFSYRIWIVVEPPGYIEAGWHITPGYFLHFPIIFNFFTIFSCTVLFSSARPSSKHLLFVFKYVAGTPHPIPTTNIY